MNSDYSLEFTYKSKDLLEYKVSVQSKEKVERNKIEEIIEELGGVKLGDYQSNSGLGDLKITITSIEENNYLQSITSIAPHKQLNWFDQLIFDFIKFIKWALNITDPATVRDLELRFAMHLFKNADQDILHLLSDQESNVGNMKLSETFSIWNHFLEGLSTHLKPEEANQIDSQISSFKKLENYQSDVEQINRIEDKEDRVAERDLLKERVKKDAAALQNNQKMYVPGGYLTKKSENFVSLIYEIEKKDDTYFLRVFEPKENADGKTKLITHQKTEIHDINEFIKDAIDAQIGPSLDVLKKSYTMMNMMQGYQPDELKDERGDANRFEIVQKYIPDLKIDEEDSFSKVESEKLVRLFFKTTLADLYKEKKTILKIASFLSLYRQIGSRMNDPAIRAWMLNSAKTLLDALNKLETKHQKTLMPSSKGAIDSLKDELGMIVQAIGKFDRTHVVEVPTVDTIAVDETIFAKPLNAPNLAKMESFQTVDVQLPHVEPLNPVDLYNTNSDEILSDYNIHLGKISQQVKEGNWEESALLLRDFSNLLEQLRDSDVLRNLKDAQIEAWSDMISQYGALSMQISYGLEYVVPTPPFIRYSLQSLVLLDMISRRPGRVFESFRFDTAPFEQILKDPYLDLGSMGPYIEKDLRYLKNPTDQPLKTLDLTTPHKKQSYQSRSDNEDFFKALIKQKHPKLTDNQYEKELNKLYEDLGQHNILPKEIVNMRKAFCISQVLMSPLRTTAFYSIIEMMGLMSPFFDIKKKGGALLSEQEEQYENNKFFNKKTIEKIQKNQGPITIEIVYSINKSRNEFVIQPFNLAINDFFEVNEFNSFKNKPLPLYADNGIPLTEQDRQLFDLGVSQYSYAPKVDEEGVLVKDYTDFCVDGKTQQAIMREKLTLYGLPSDIIQEFELMQTGTPTKVKETIGKLNKHIGLLNDGKAAPVLQKLFERNLFRNNLVIEQLRAEPAYAKVLMQTLYDIVEKQKQAGQYRSALFVVDLMEQISLIIEELALEEINKDNNDAPILEPFPSKTLLAEVESIMKNEDSGDYLRDLHFYRLRGFFHQNRFSRNKEDAINSGKFGDHQKEYIQGLHMTYTEEVDFVNKVLESFCFLQVLPESFVVDPQKMSDIDHYMHIVQPRIYQFMNEPNLDIHASSLNKLKQRDQICNHLAHILDPNIKEGLTKDATYKERQKLADDLGLRPAVKKPPKSSLELKWESQGDSGLLFKSGNRILDLKNGRLYVDGKTYTTLPGNVLKHPEFKQIKQMLLNGGVKEEELSNLVATLRNVEENGISGQRYDFSLKQHGMKVDFRLILTKDDKIRFYKRGPENNWYQYQENLFASEIDKKDSQVDPLALRKHDSAPRELQKCDCWIQDKGEFLLAEKDGKPVYTARLEGHPPVITYLESIKPKQVILNPWSLSQFNVFSTIEDPSHITVKGTDGKAEEIIYNRFNLAFKWDEGKGKWVSPQHKGYYLSKNTLMSALRGTKEPDASENLQAPNELQNLFSGTFTHYQMLESDTGRPKLLLSATQYTKKGDPEKHTQLVPHLQKHAHQLHPVFNLDNSNVPLFSYRIEPKGLVCDNVEGYLYLAYVLMAQGKYKEAIRYLKRSDINLPQSILGKNIMSWIASFDDNSPGARVVKMHLSLMILRQPNFNPNPATIKNLETQYGEYLEMESGDKILDAWKLSIEEVMEFTFGISKFKNESEVKLNPAGLISVYEKEIAKLNREIIVRERNLKKTKSEPNSFEKTAIRLFSPVAGFDIFNQVDADKRQLSEKIDNTKYGVALSNQSDAFARTIGKDLQTDLGEEIKEQQIGVLKKDDIAGFKKKAAHYQNVNDSTGIVYKNQIMNLLPPPAQHEGVWNELLEQINRQNTNWREIVFDTILRCAGEGDWSPLRKIYPGLSDENINEISILCKEFLKNSIRAQQCLQIIKASDELKRLEEGTEEYAKKNKEVYDLATASWSYDPDKDPDALSFLLIEYELGFVCRPSQVDIIRSSIVNDNQFKQEVCGGGKTTVLRNVIAHLRADGATLAAVSTLEPLKKEHGLMFARTTLHAYGQKSFDFTFDRTSPTDKVSLLKLHINLLRMVAERGRVDLTKSDLQSFRLAMILKQEQILELRNKNLQGKDEVLNIKIMQLHQELDVMEDIRDLLRARASINADELDKDCDPTQEKIYAHGKRVSLDNNAVEGGSELMHMILTSKDPDIIKLRTIVRLNPQTKLSTEDLAKARMHLAGILFDKYHTQLQLTAEQRNIFIAYMTEIKDKNLSDTQFSDSINGFFNAHIKPDPKDTLTFALKSKLCFMHDFLSAIIPSAAEKRGGVNYGRSADRIHVIHYAGSDKPKEGYEHGLESERIWYTLLDYADTSRGDKGGVSADQIGQLVQSYRKRAVYEMEVARKSKKDTPLKTKAEMEFKNQFGLSLKKVSEKDFNVIAEKINRDPNLLIDFIKFSVFSEYQKNTQNIKSNAQDPPNMVKSYSGSAGTDNAKYTLPDSIDISDVRMKGAHGAVLQSLIASDRALGKEEGSFLIYQESKVNWKPGVVGSNFSNLRPGDKIFNVGEIVKKYAVSQGKVPTMFDVANAIAKAHPDIPVVYIEKDGTQVFVNNAQPTNEPIQIDYNPEANQLPTLLDVLGSNIQGGDCLSDVGVAFPGVSALEIAQALSKSKPELTFRFINRNDEWQMYKNGKVIPVDTSIPLNEVFTIFDDTHTRGAERPSTDNVTEFVTVNENTPWSRFEQGVMRERGVTKGKAQVKYLLSPGLSQKLRQNPTLEMLFSLLVKNEAAELKPLDLKAEKQKIAAISRHGIEDALRRVTHLSRSKESPSHYEARELINHVTNGYFVTSTETTAEEAGSPTNKVHAGKNLEKMAENELLQLQGVIKELRGIVFGRGGVTQELIEEFCSDLEKTVIPKLAAKQSSKQTGENKPRISDDLIPEEDFVRAGNKDLDMQQSVEQEQEQQSEMQMQQEQKVQQSQNLTRGVDHERLRWKDQSWDVVLPTLNRAFNTIVNMSQVSSAIKINPKDKNAMALFNRMVGSVLHSFHAYAPHMPKNKVFTENFMSVMHNWDLGVKPWSVLAKGEQLPPDQNRVSRTMFVIDLNTGNVGEVVPSLKDNDTDIEEFVRNNAEDAAANNYVLSMYNYDTGRVDGGIVWEKLPLDVVDKINEQIVSTKFFNGEVDFFEMKEKKTPQDRLTDQYGALVKWLSGCGADLDELESSFKSFIAANRPSQVYKGSDLERAFQEAKTVKV